MQHDRTIAQAVEGAASSDPTRGFRFVPEDGNAASEASFSYTAIERASARYGGALQALGLKKGDRVALILPTNEDFVICFFGAIRAGMVPVPIYPPLGLGHLQSYLDNTRHIVAKCGARALVTTSKIKRMLGTVQAECPELEDVVAVEAIRESMEPLRPEKIALDDTAFIQFTSGSTSRPKGVALSHANIAANIKCIMHEGLAAKDDDIGVSWLPLYHDMGLIGFVLAPLFYRVPVIFLPPLLFLKRPASWLHAITRHKGSIAYGPNFSYALCVKRIRERDLEGVDLSSWRVAGCGAEPIRPETLESFCDMFAKVGFKREAILPSYGMAEASLAITFAPLAEGLTTITVDAERLWGENEAVPIADGDEHAVRLVSCGRAFEDHKVQIFDLEDAASEHPLAERRVGEIRIAGPSVMRGYWEDAERTREAFAGPFLRTGDLGFLDGGRIFICGRSKEVVIVNGRNYYPQDIEWEAGKVAGVRRGNVIAFGARDPSGIDRDRERVIVAFEMQNDPNRDAKTTGDDAKRQALAYAVRKAVQEGIGLTLDDVIALPAGALPKTSSGKLQRAKARALYEENDLVERKSPRGKDSLGIVKHAALSQLSYFKLAVLGGRKKE